MYRTRKCLLVLLVSMLSIVGCEQNNTSKDISETQEAMPLDAATITAILNKQSTPVTLSEEDTLIVNDILEKGEWNEESTAECINNCSMSINGIQLYYHSECGTFNDSVNNRNLVLDNETRLIINNIFEKYIVLDTVETPM